MTDTDIDPAPTSRVQVTALEEFTAPREIYRARAGRVFAGVCAGLARRSGLDPSFVRALVVLSCFVGGAGFVGYAAAVLLLPVEPRATPDELDEEPVHDPLYLWGGVLLLGLGALLATRIGFLQFRLFSLASGSAWPALWIVAALAAVRRQLAVGELPEIGLTRPRHDRLALGVASGFARYARVDPNLVRLFMAIVTFWSHGLGFLLYLVLAAFIPEEI